MSIGWDFLGWDRGVGCGIGNAYAADQHHPRWSRRSSVTARRAAVAARAIWLNLQLILGFFFPCGRQKGRHRAPWHKSFRHFLIFFSKVRGSQSMAIPDKIVIGKNTQRDSTISESRGPRGSLGAHSRTLRETRRGQVEQSKGPAGETVLPKT